jgi:hypothetical protein
MFLRWHRFDELRNARSGRGRGVRLRDLRHTDAYARWMPAFADTLARLHDLNVGPYRLGDAPVAMIDTHISMLALNLYLILQPALGRLRSRVF